MRKVTLFVKLDGRTKTILKRLIRRGSTPNKVVRRCRVLLWWNDGANAQAIADDLDVSTATAKRIRRRFLDGGWERAVYDLPRPGRNRSRTREDEEAVIAMACSPAPDGRSRWTIRVLAEKTNYSYSVVQKILSEAQVKPWREKKVVHSDS